MHNLEETMKNRNLYLTALLAAVMLTACGPAAQAPAATETATEATTEVNEIMEPPVTEETEEPTEESAPTVAPVTTEKATEETTEPVTEATKEVEKPETEENAEPVTEETQATEATVEETTVATDIPATLSAADYQSYSGGNLSALEAVLGTNHTWEVTKGCLVDGGDMGLAVWTAADGTAITAQCEMNAGSTEWIVKFVF